MDSPLNIEVSSSILPENFISSVHKKELSKSPQAMVTISQMIMEWQTTLSTEELIKILPKGQKRIFFNDNGSTAVEAAIKMALQ